MEKKHEFYNYDKEHVDRDSQKKEAISEIEELIYKPFREGGNDITNLTEEEFEQYCALSIEELRKTKINAKTLILLEATQKAIEGRKESILKRIREKRKKEEQESER